MGSEAKFLEFNRDNIFINQDLRYYAGLFDGEGCVSCVLKIVRSDHRLGIYPTVTISCCRGKTAFEPLLKIYGGKIGIINPKGTRKTAMDYYRIVNRSKMLSFLKAIEPFCIVKKEETRLGMSICRKLIEGKACTKEGLISILRDVQVLKEIHGFRGDKGHEPNLLIEDVETGKIFPSRRRWFTEEEKQFIFKRKGKMSSKSISAIMVYRTPNAVRQLLWRNNMRTGRGIRYGK